MLKRYSSRISLRLVLIGLLVDSLLPHIGILPVALCTKSETFWQLIRAINWILIILMALTALDLSFLALQRGPKVNHFESVRLLLLHLGRVISVPLISFAILGVLKLQPWAYVFIIDGTKGSNLLFMVWVCQAWLYWGLALITLGSAGLFIHSQRMNEISMMRDWSLRAETSRTAISAIEGGKQP